MIGDLEEKKELKAGACVLTRAMRVEAVHLLRWGCLGEKQRWREARVLSF